ncbi:DUF1669 domain-containing protein [Candidatus Dependentiae bacterium]|nr:DUF1669 domain-containing protein [Candidatus Dependentiae bacterium]
MKFFQKIILGGVFLSVVVCFMGIARVISHYQDPQHTLETMLINKDNTIARAYFSPDDKVASLLKGLIEVEKKMIRVSIYTLTDKSIITALIDAAKRGVVVECVVDPGYGSDRYSQVYQLANAQIGVWSYQASSDQRNSSLMHNKFCIFDDSVQNHAIVWTGSYNFTKRANERNQENVVILDNPEIVDRFRKHFEILKDRSLQISGKIQTQNRSRNKSESSWFDQLKTFFKMF